MAVDKLFQIIKWLGTFVQTVGFVNVYWKIIHR